MYKKNEFTMKWNATNGIWNNLKLNTLLENYSQFFFGIFPFLILRFFDVRAANFVTNYFTENWNKRKNHAAQFVIAIQNKVCQSVSNLWIYFTLQRQTNTHAQNSRRDAHWIFSHFPMRTKQKQKQRQEMVKYAT